MYIWRAYLDDGTIIDEGQSSEFVSSEHLPKDRVARLEYVPVEGKPNQSERPVGIDIDLKNGERFFRVWRKSESFNLFAPKDSVSSTVFVCGVEKYGRKLYSVYLYPDGHVVVSTNSEL